MSIREILDTPNWVLDGAEYVQDIRDRDIRLLGISDLADRLEEYFQPDYEAFVRARWSRINHIRAKDTSSWQEVRGTRKSGRSSKQKKLAVVLSVAGPELEELRQEGYRYMWPAAAYIYRGIGRAGIYHSPSNQVAENKNIAMLVGKSNFEASMGYLALRNNIATVNEVRRSDIRQGTLLLPANVETVDIIPADELPPDLPLV
ncbi:MAG TPA: hypothetical protein VFW90_02315 [Candidatus Saccharimonadales bacterium]|nr:hypothetical protein [Candidatus Saccharimonadales bacterium]